MAVTKSTSDKNAFNTNKLSKRHIENTQASRVIEQQRRVLNRRIRQDKRSVMQIKQIKKENSKLKKIKTFTIQKHVENKSMQSYTTKTTKEYKKSDLLKMLGYNNRFKLRN